MGADNQAERVIERMEREEKLIDSAIRLIRELELNSMLSESALAAMLDLKRTIIFCGYDPNEKPYSQQENQDALESWKE